MILKSTVLVDGKHKQVQFVRRGLDVWYHLDGETHKYSISSKIKEAHQGASGGVDGVYTAPMPGKIMKLLVQSGQKVKMGQNLLVMEAMKMEYSIEAAFDGTISEVSFEAGQQVSLGDVLVRLEKEE